MRTLPLRQATFALVVLLALAFSFHVRQGQFDTWKERPEKFFVDAQPLVTSMDGFFWVKTAQDFRGGIDTPRDKLRNHPDGVKRIRPVPLLSLMLVGVSSVFGVGLYTAGTYLISILAGLFIVPLALYFRKIELPAAGILGGLLTTFCYAYFTRTSVGGVDTDALILFFPLLISLFILHAGESESRKSVLLFSALAGFSMLLFYWWYLHEGFAVVYLGLLVLYLIVGRRDWKTVGWAALVFAVACNPLYLLKGIRALGFFVSSYVFASWDERLAGSIALPNPLRLIREAQTESITETLKLVLDQPLLVVLGLVLFGTAAVTRWKRLLPLLPLLVLGLVAFRGGRRFAMFLAPFVGAGYGFVLGILIQRLSDRVRAMKPYRDATVCVAGLLAFLPFSALTAIDFSPSPTLSSETIRSIGRLKEQLPAGSVVLSWWDYGFALGAVGEFATFHDGSSHGVNSYLIAKALSSTSQQELYATTAFVNRTGAETIGKTLAGSPSPEKTLADIGRHSGPVGREDVYLLFLEAMIPKYNAIHYLGNWDFETRTGQREGYQRLKCSTWANEQLRCEGLTIDSGSGSAGPGLTLERLIMIRNGKIVHDQLFSPGSGVVLQVLSNDDGAFAFYLLSDRAFRSNFNQMYFLGEYDRSRFELIEDDFPVSRVFRFKARPG